MQILIRSVAASMMQFLQCSGNADDVLVSIAGDGEFITLEMWLKWAAEARSNSVKSWGNDEGDNVFVNAILDYLGNNKVVNNKARQTSTKVTPSQGKAASQPRANLPPDVVMREIVIEKESLYDWGDAMPM